uniref:Eukaryotic translation initiation factor 4E transporter n=1 Tax=Cacopsylla melanoneura TaxID=428564 RepID=A0A8D8X7M2_9HEMI
MCDTVQAETGDTKKEDTSICEDKDIWKESLLDATDNLLDSAEDGKGREEEEGEDKEKEKEEGEITVPELQYSRAQLYEIQKLPSSQVKPEFLDSFPIQARFSFVRGVWEREGGSGGPNPPSNQQGGGGSSRTNDRWPRAVTPNEGTYDGYNDNKMRRSLDSRGGGGLVRGGAKDSPDPILSPQRRTFNSGCYVPPGGSLMGTPRDNKTMDRDSMGRRFVGTGRVGWGSNDGLLGGTETTFVAPNLMPDYTQRGSGGTSSTSGGSQAGPGALQNRGGSSQAGDVFERRYADVKRTNTRTSGEYRNNGDYHRNSGGGNDFNRNNSNDYSRNNGNEYDRGGGGRYNGVNDNRRHRNNSDNRNHHNHQDSEPEWWSEGPTSQNDVIELRGFYDDDTKDGSGSSPDSRKNSESERVQRKSSSSSGGGDLSNVKEVADSADREKTNSGNTGREPLLSFGNTEPNIDDLLNNLDSIFTNNTEPVSSADQNSGGGSRFSRWFRSESPGTQQPPQSPSPHHMINDLINDITEERSQTQHRYSPVSPHHPRAGLPPGANFLDMMLKQSQEGGVLRSGSIRDLEGVGKLHSVEELEAKMRPVNGPASHHNNPMNKEQDMANFKKLMMTKLLQQQHHLAQNMHQQAQVSGVTPGGHHLPHHAAGPWANLLAQQNRIDQEIVHKIVKIQQAQEYQRRMAALGLGPQPAPGGAGYLPTSPLPPELQHHLLNNPQFDARNLIRPIPGVGPLSPSQAQAPLNGPPPLAGPMTPGGPSFLQSGGPLNHPMGPGGKQFLLSTPPPGAPSPGNSSVFQQQQQQQRIPSPNQLAAHTQAILQNAILKKKIQEQKETLRKRHEHLMQRPSSPSAQPTGHELRPSQSSPNVINAFTPTSVLRKMTAHPQAHDQNVPPSNQHEKDLLLIQSSSHSTPTGSPWAHLNNSRPQPNLGHNKNSVINLGNQQIPQQVGPKPRSKFTVSSNSLQQSKSGGHLPSSVADQIHILSQDSHHVNPFTSHHSQSGSGVGSRGLVPEQLEKWFSSPEFLTRAPPPPSQNLLSVEELERHAPTAPGAATVQN